MTERNSNRPGYKKTTVGWIPKEWTLWLLHTIAEVQTGKRPLSGGYDS
jgi:hypothetical protein